MYLTTQDIEDIAAAVLVDFRKTTGIKTLYTPIDRLAGAYLGLQVKFAKLSDDGSLLGLTTYADTNVKVKIGGKENICRLHANEILLDASFVQPAANVHKLYDIRHITLAHECAHQILFALESDSMKNLHKRKYSTRRAYSCRDLKTKEDWNEWQANALGAALLIPADSLKSLLKSYKIRTFQGKLRRNDRMLIEELCKIFKVSRSTMMNRLKNLGFMVSARSTHYKREMVSA